MSTEKPKSFRKRATLVTTDSAKSSILPSFCEPGPSTWHAKGKVYHPWTKRLNQCLVTIFVLTLVITRYISTLDHLTKRNIKNKAVGVLNVAEKWGFFGSKPFETNYIDDYPELKLLEDNFHVIQKELAHLMETRKRDITDMQKMDPPIYKEPMMWKTLWLKIGWPIEENRHLAPQTVALLEQIPNMYSTLLF